MTDAIRLIFYIDAYTPDSIPLAKLADYMADFAALLGKENAVRFGGLEPGSTRLAARVAFEDVPKVTARLHDIRRGDAPKDAARLFAQIDDRLANDNAVGRIFVEGGEAAAPAELLAFPGRERPKPLSYGPFTQEGSLDGILISVGGKDETISIRLQNGEITYSNCETNRTIARELGKHLFEPIRIHGTGRWMREADGGWTLRAFRVHRFEALQKESLREAVTALRAVHGSGWTDVPIRWRSWRNSAATETSCTEMVVFDASILLFLFNENAPASVPRAKERVEDLIDQLSDAGEKIVIPTPALSECLVHAGPAGPEYLTIIDRQACFRVASSISGPRWRARRPSTRMTTTCAPTPPRSA